MPESIWERFEHDPRHPAHAPLRASDRDRDVVHDLLGAAYSDGRLTREELDERADRVTRAKTLGELPPLVDDLVAPTGSAPVPTLPGVRGMPSDAERRGEAERKYRHLRNQALWAFLTPTLICWVVWTATMFGGFPWPVFVTIGTGIRFAQLATTRQDTIASIERGIERRERKRLDRLERRQSRELRAPYPPPPEGP